MPLKFEFSLRPPQLCVSKLKRVTVEASGCVVLPCNARALASVGFTSATLCRLPLCLRRVWFAELHLSFALASQWHTFYISTCKDTSDHDAHSSSNKSSSPSKSSSSSSRSSRSPSLGMMRWPCQTTPGTSMNDSSIVETSTISASSG